MKEVGLVTAALMILVASTGAQERNVLVEMFTNSHCGLCPPAHGALTAYGSSSPNASRIRYIYYHVPFPYPDDPLAQVATSDAAGRNQYYGPFSATPVTFFDGANQGTAYASWETSLNNRVSVASPLNIALRGNRTGSDAAVSATIHAVGSLPSGPLAIHFVIVEDVSYAGRNGITPQNFVMRKMLAGGSGETFTIVNGETKIIEKTTPLTNVTSMDKAGFVVFVQEVGTKAIVQSDYISYGILADVDDAGSQPATYLLEQNYPNPFNPTTVIRYQLPVASSVRLVVYDMLGREVKVLVDEREESGSHQVDFDGSGLSSGMYFYKMDAGAFVQTRALLLLR